MANWLFQEGPRLETGSGSNPLGNQRVIAPDRLPDSGDLSWEPSGKGLAVREDGQAGTDEVKRASPGGFGVVILRGACRFFGSGRCLLRMP